MRAAVKPVLIPRPSLRSAGNWRRLKGRASASSRLGTEQYAQLLFEVIKTRSALFHSLDQTIGANAVDEIIEAAEQSARQYLARFDSAPEAKQ